MPHEPIDNTPSPKLQSPEKIDTPSSFSDNTYDWISRDHVEPRLSLSLDIQSYLLRCFSVVLVCFWGPVIPNLSFGGPGCIRIEFLNMSMCQALLNHWMLRKMPALFSWKPQVMNASSMEAIIPAATSNSTVTPAWRRIDF